MGEGLLVTRMIDHRDADLSKHVDTDKLTTANGGTFTSSSAIFSSQSRSKARQSLIDLAVT